MSLNAAIEGRQIPLSTATKAQLKAFALHLGANVTNFDSEDKLREKIAAAGWDQSSIVAIDAQDAPTSKAPAATKDLTEPMVDITIHTQDGAGGKRAVFVAVNGRALLIPRNKRCSVKLRYVKALENAIETKYEFDEELKANAPRDTPSYPFQVHTMPSRAEQDAWYAHEAKADAAQRTRDRAEEARIRSEMAKQEAA